MQELTNRQVKVYQYTKFVVRIGVFKCLLEDKQKVKCGGICLCIILLSIWIFYLST